MFIWGNGGIGKSYTVVRQLDALEVNHQLLNSRVTGWGLICHLEQYPSHVTLIEDAESMYRDPRAIGVLRSALAPGAEPPREELVRALQAGRQPYLVVVSRCLVLFGWEMVTAARAAGVASIDVRRYVADDQRNEDELLLAAVALHLAAVRQRVPVDPFEFRLLMARVYREWAAQVERRAPRKRTPEARREREETRQRLIREAFGRAQRSLQRDLVLLNLPPDLLDAVRTGRLPERYIEAAEKLTSEKRKKLTAALADGTPVADIGKMFFGESDGRRKTPLAVSAAARTALHTFVAETRGREHWFALTSDDRPVARGAVEYLSRLLDAESKTPLDEMVQQLAKEVGGDAPKASTPKAATRGGRGAEGGRA